MVDDESARRAARRRVFVSHSSRDRWVARQIAREVEERGAEAFLDEARIEVGADFQAELRAALDQADELIVLWTPSALERPFVWAEVGAAWLKQIPIIQLLYGLTSAELQARPGFPVFLTMRDMIDLDDINAYLDQLSRRVGRGG